jgi:hypothetical protein
MTASNGLFRLTDRVRYVFLCFLQEEIYSSSYAAAAYLESIDFKKKVRGWRIDRGGHAE